MNKILMSGAIALVVGSAGFAVPAAAQTCPPGYYFASDGRCYPGGPPTAPPPVYDYAPPVYQPPAVFDGFALGIGLGAVLGAIGNDHDHDRRHDYRRDDRRYYRR